MKGRKLLALVLSGALTLGLAAPALAAEMTAEEATTAQANTPEPTIESAEADQALLAVTAKVKLALELDTDAYQDFQGWSTEDVLLGRRWNLEWVGDGADLSVVADDSGKVYSFNRYESAAAEPNFIYGGKLNIPRLPEDKSQAALATAQSFLDRVLDAKVESVTLESSNLPSLQQTSYRYSGMIKLNDLPSPITCSVTVRASDLAVTRFSRSDQYGGYVGGVPGVSTHYTEAHARAQLATTISMKAEYVLDAKTKVAVLRYLPVSGDEYYVDGVTGKLVNLSQLYKQLWSAERGGATSANKYALTEEAMADMASPTAGLTQAERDGAALLHGAMAKEDLDKILKNAWPEMGLGEYTLASAAYSVREKTPAGAEKEYDVTCRLTYAQDKGQLIRNKTVTVDAKTGAVQNLFSSRSYRGEGEDTYHINYIVGMGQTKAEAAMKVLSGSRADKLALAETVNAQESKGWEHLYTYQQSLRGYFYPGNYYTVGIDATDGTLSRLNFSYDDDVILQIPDKVVDASVAQRAYLAALEAPYGYLEVPVAVSQVPGDIMPLLKEAGYSYVSSLKTGYTLSQPKGSYVSGVDAETGQAVIDTFDADRPAPLAYNDLEGHWVKNAAEALAVFGVGLRSDSLEPGKTMTQLDMVALLASVDGYSFDSATATAEEVDWLYRYAYTLGLLTPETRDETKVITRGEMVKLILDGAGYQRVAALPGIFRCDFADAASLEGATLGYAALAQGLGLVNGGSSAAYAPDRDITRAEAIAMLYQYMK